MHACVRQQCCFCAALNCLLLPALLPRRLWLQVWLVKLADVESPEEAALLRGHTLLIPASAREALEDEDEFYVQVGRGRSSGCLPGMPWLGADCCIAVCISYRAH
jgi:hypothetical protein